MLDHHGLPYGVWLPIGRFHWEMKTSGNVEVFLLILPVSCYPNSSFLSNVQYFVTDFSAESDTQKVSRICFEKLNQTVHRARNILEEIAYTVQTAHLYQKPGRLLKLLLYNKIWKVVKGVLFWCVLKANRGHCCTALEILEGGINLNT